MDIHRHRCGKAEDRFAYAPSPALSTRFKRISKPLSIQVARSLHFLVPCWFLVFILVHTTLVFTTGLVRNLNMGYAAQDSNSWIGLGSFAASMVVVAVAWVAATPLTLRRPRLVQRLGFALIGPLQRLFEHVDAKPGEYSERDVSPYFWLNGAFPQTQWIAGIEFVAHLSEVGGGHGGYNEDHQFFGYRQSI